jgi:hypothetical protein
MRQLVADAGKSETGQLAHEVGGRQLPHVIEQQIQPVVR